MNGISQARLPVRVLELQDCTAGLAVRPERTESVIGVLAQIEGLAAKISRMCSR
jgi:hypothetical protein